MSLHLVIIQINLANRTAAFPSSLPVSFLSGIYEHLSRITRDGIGGNNTILKQTHTPTAAKLKKKKGEKSELALFSAFTVWLRSDHITQDEHCPHIA